MKNAVIIVAGLCVAACGAPGADLPAHGPRSEAGAAYLVDGTPEGIGVLRLLNDARTDILTLDVDARLERRAAVGLVAHRNGPDKAFGTADDDLFDSIGEVDGVRYVGPTALAQLAAYAERVGRVPDGDERLGAWDGVAFTVEQASATVERANTLSGGELDEAVGLDRRAVASIVLERPVGSVLELSQLYYVGKGALTALRDYRPAGEGDWELGIISDLDKTVIPPQADDLPEPPYPGVATLYRALELRDGGSAGDLRFVTARDEQRVEGVADWLQAHGVPGGPIATGTTGRPWEARREKVADITTILHERPGQAFVLFGDSSHVDPEVYRDIVDAYPDRVLAVFIHKVTRTVRADRVDGFHLIDHYAEAASVLLREGVIGPATARAVIDAARSEGLELTDAEADGLMAAGAVR